MQNKKFRFSVYPIVGLVITFLFVGNITLTNAQGIPPPPPPPTISSISSGDLDGNGQDDMVIGYNDYGISVYMNNSSWIILHKRSVKHISCCDIDGDVDGKDDVIIDFGPGIGIYVRMNNSSWVKLHKRSAEHITCCNIDGDVDGKDDVLIDFGPGIGIYVRMNDSSWVKLHKRSAKHISCCDMDGNGQDDVIVDFGPGIGIYVRMNNSTTWERLHKQSPDINPRCDV